MLTIPRAPGHFPLLGHTWPLWRRPFELLEHVHRMADVVEVKLGTLPVYFLTRPELINEVLAAKSRSFEKGRLFDRMRRLLGDGLPVSGGDFHRTQRRLIQPAFHRTRIEAYVEIMARHARQRVESWQPGREVVIDREMHELILAIIAEAMCSTATGSAAVAEIHRSLPPVARGALVRAFVPKLLDPLPIPLNRRFDVATDRLRTVVDDVIAKYHAEQIVADDLLSMLLAARDADTGEPMPDVQVRDEMLTMLYGGTETSATTLAWAFHELGHHPEVAARLRAELARVLGERTVAVGDLPALTYTDQVLREATRLHSLPLLMRRAIEPVELGGTRFPAGTEFGLSQYALHRDPKVYPRPEVFDPDRWAPDAPPPPKGAFIPFGAGNRKCIGDAFAWAEMLVVLATVVARWRLEPVAGHTVRKIPAAAPRPDAVPMTVHPIEPR
jgi:cytochrome P450